MTFASDFENLTGNPPFPWQEALYRRFVGIDPGGIPSSCNLPTGLGKTSVVAVWLIAFANGASVPRRLIYVVNRRTVVDQTTVEVERYCQAIDSSPKLADFKSRIDALRISTLRGQFADNGDWCEDPSKPAVICGTVDMIGSRLLFSGYGIGRNKRPLHAGFLGQDVLLIHDEAHLEPAFQKLIESIEVQQRDSEPVTG
jgi:CRISPR-associated endonuclease/helicase Cas3